MISITSNAAQVAKGLDKAAKQMPFATALALTKSAQAAQSEVRDHLGDSFTLRNGWVSKGIRVKPARKSNLEALVFTKDQFMALQYEGGDRVPFSKGKDAVPVGARRNPRDFTRKASYPGKILGAGGRGYKIRLSDGSIGVFKRKGHGKRSKSVLFWILAKKIEVKPDWHFAEQVDRAVARTLPGELKKAIAHAIATARPPAT